MPMLAAFAVLALIPATALATPTLSTGAAENSSLAGSDEAFLHADITPGCENATVAYTAEWGTSSSYGSSQSKSLNSPYGTAYDDYTRATGLTPGTLYYYRGKATITCPNGGTGGTVVGGGRCFVAGQAQPDGTYNVPCPGPTTDPVPASGGGSTPSPDTTMPGLAVWPSAVRTKGVRCATIRKLFQRNAKRGKLFSSKRHSMRPGPYRCVAIAVRASVSVTGFGLWKCKKGKRYFHYTNEAFGSWTYKPYGPLFDVALR